MFWGSNLCLCMSTWSLFRIYQIILKGVTRIHVIKINKQCDICRGKPPQISCFKLFGWMRELKHLYINKTNTFWGFNSIRLHRLQLMATRPRVSVNTDSRVLACRHASTRDERHTWPCTGNIPRALGTAGRTDSLRHCRDKPPSGNAAAPGTGTALVEHCIRRYVHSQTSHVITI